jgi:hypothetical protein
MAEKFDDGGNPFALPSEEEVFKMREEEKRRKTEERRRAHGKKIWEKTTATSNMGRTRKIGDDELPGAGATAGKGIRVPGKAVVSAATAAIRGDRSREKDNMSDFIAKKREMFLVQMALDTKREEIQKLEHKAHMKEEALRKSELMLEEDAIRFDAFLKENDKQAHEALKAAEREAKLKADKVQEIKKLKHAISLIQGEKSKCKEALDDCERYREFLEGLTPPEWKEEQREIKRRRQEERRRARHAAKVADWEERLAGLVETLDKREEEARRKALKEGRMFKKRDVHSEAAASMPAKPALEEEAGESSGEELPMYFRKPEQLLERFTQLEESNLFLIQNCQETEQQLEELRTTYRETERVMSKQATALADSIAMLKSQIEEEEKHAEALSKRVSIGGSDDPQRQLLDALTERVKDVYTKCGFDVGSNPTPLSMLTSVEGKLEELLLDIEHMNPDYVIRKEKEKEKERREKVREERLAQQQQQYEMRLQKSMERAQAPVKKKTGKPVMFRSAPIKKKVKKAKRDPKKEQEARDLVFLS